MGTLHKGLGYLLVLAAPWACSSTDAVDQAPSGSAGSAATSAGESVYSTPLSDGNTFTCATCHALSEPSSDGLRRPGHALANATRRGSWKNGRAKTFLDAANSCVTEWMVATPWLATDAAYRDLYDFLESKATLPSAPPISFDIVQPPADTSEGDAVRGLELFNHSCTVCHGDGGVGTVRGPRVAGSKRSAPYIAERIRLSGNAMSPTYDGLTGGVMPFWAKDRLSDVEVRDLIAFITANAIEPGGQGGASGQGGEQSGSGGAAAGSFSGGGAGGAPSTAGTGGGGATGCTKTNPRIGWTADLGVNTGEGQVSGFVTMVDDCTLELHDFSYDGNGIDVRVYGSLSKSFKPGFGMGENLVGKTFSRATYRVTLPEGKSLDSLDWVSIWCVAASANFGSGPFLPPSK